MNAETDDGVARFKARMKELERRHDAGELTDEDRALIEEMRHDEEERKRRHRDGAKGRYWTEAQRRLSELWRKLTALREELSKRCESADVAALSETEITEDVARVIASARMENGVQMDDIRQKLGALSQRLLARDESYEKRELMAALISLDGIIEEFSKLEVKDGRPIDNH